MNQSVLEPLAVTPKEAAELLGVSRAKVNELVAAGEMPAMRVGRRQRIPIEALREWVRQRTGTPRPSSAVSRRND
jgi:excisionase family DNA binding protein